MLRETRMLIKCIPIRSFLCNNHFKCIGIWYLIFTQISEFCGLHELEVQGIADGDVAIGMQGNDPIDIIQLTKEE